MLEYWSVDLHRTTFGLVLKIKSNVQERTERIWREKQAKGQLKGKTWLSAVATSESTITIPPTTTIIMMTTAEYYRFSRLNRDIMC